MSAVYIWWHEKILAHRVKGPQTTMDNRGPFRFRKCQCGKWWVQ